MVGYGYLLELRLSLRHCWRFKKMEEALGKKLCSFFIA